MQKRLLFLVSLLLWLTTTMMAQVTTSSMSGKVVLQGTNDEIIGATVQAVHEPSGTRWVKLLLVLKPLSLQQKRRVQRLTFLNVKLRACLP